MQVEAACGDPGRLGLPVRTLMWCAALKSKATVTPISGRLVAGALRVDFLKKPLEAFWSDRILHKVEALRACFKAIFQDLKLWRPLKSCMALMTIGSHMSFGYLDKTNLRMAQSREMRRRLTAKR